MKSESIQNQFNRVVQTVAEYYPEGRTPIDPQFEAEFTASPEWSRHLQLRNDEKQHLIAAANIHRLLATTCENQHIDDHSCPSLYPGYHFRILLEPRVAWPDQTEWNWDLKLITATGRMQWLELFYSYLGPFFAAVSSSFVVRENVAYISRLPAETEPATRAYLVPARSGFEKAGWEYLPFEVLCSILPAFASDTGGLGELTVFELLFNDTYPSPLHWDGSWMSLGSLSFDKPDVVDGNIEDVPVGELIAEANLRHTIDLERRPSRKKPIQ